MKAGKLLSVDKLTVYADRIVALVSVDVKKAYTTPELAKQALEQRPSLAHHTCINEKGPTFAAVVEHTPLPHLFEHVIVDILSQESMDYAESGETASVFPKDESVENPSSGLVVGTSEWLDRKVGTARVEVSYQDDLVALAAFKSAEEFLNNMTA